MPGILDHQLISHCYFFPRQDEVKNVRLISTRDGCTLCCGFLRGSTDRTLLFFHGNGETASDWEPIIGPFLMDCGWSVVFVEYRGYGGSSGNPKLAAMLSDGEDVIQALNLDPTNVVAFGRSIGSIYAIELAKRMPLAGLILDSGIHDVRERLLLRVSPDELGITSEFFDREVAAHFDHADKLSRFDGPVLILHANDDQLIEINHAHKNAAACQRPTLRIFDYGGHNAIYPTNRRDYQAAVRLFLDQVRPA